MDPYKTALILIGYQNDYFASDGILHQVIEETSRIGGTLKNTIDLLERLKATPVLLVSTPIIFTPDYSELVDPVGILKTIVEVGAFKAGEKGSETIPELFSFGERIVKVPGKRGLNAFSNTDLDDLLKEKGIKDVLLAGVVTSICIDSTGRSAFERGYNVSVLSDCTSGRSIVEQDFYFKEIFPIYANVLDHRELLKSLGIDG
jgi:nicotinamidase-related amidase